jgi:hypothetical protein
MFRNSDSDNDTKAGHTRSGRAFREFHLANLFNKNYGDEGFYSGEEADLMEKEHSEPTRVEERKVEEPRRDKIENSGSTQIAEVSNIVPPIISTTLIN